MADRVFVVADLSGGRNGIDAPFGPLFGANQVIDAINVDWFHTSGLRKRRGSSLLSMAGSVWTGAVVWLGRHVPGTSEGDAELWGLDEGSAGLAGTFQHLKNSATWTQPAAVADAPTAPGPWNVTSASLDGKLFIAYDSGVDRLHCYDPMFDVIRRTGIDSGTVAPTASDINAGSNPKVLRYYRVRFHGAGGPGEATPPLVYTPVDASHEAVRVLRPAPPLGEQPDGWVLEASQENEVWIQLIGLPISSTLHDDIEIPSNYTVAKYPLAPLTGEHGLQKSYRFIAADNNRLLGFGNYFPTNKQARIELSAIVGSRDQGDAERVDTTSTWYYDLDEKDSGVPTALVGPLYGNFYPMKSRQLWELAPTGQVDNPYRVTAISKQLGCVAANATCVGEDRAGEPCLYFMSHRGVCRYGLDGIKYVGRGIEDLVLQINMQAANSVCHMTWHADLRQLWVWFATGSADDPDTLCVLDVVSGGWAQFIGTLAQARCSVAFARSIGPVMGFPLTPYIGSTTGPNTVTKCDDETLPLAQDNGVTYQGFVTTKPLEPAGAGYRGRMRDMQLLTKPPGLGTPVITVAVTTDFGTVPAKIATTKIAADYPPPYRYNLRVEDSEIGSAQFVQYQIGDGAPSDSLWTIDRLAVVVTPDSEPAT